MNRPKLITPIALSVLAVAAIVAAVWIGTRSDGDPIVISALVLVVLVLTAATIGTAVNWAMYEYTLRDMERRRAESVTPMLEIVNAVQRLSRDQLNLVQAQGYHAMIGVIATKNGPLTFLATPLGNIPMNIVERELRATGLVKFPPIRNFPDGSPEREWRRLFQAWACNEVGLAVPPVGPDTARWIAKDSRAIAASMLGLDIYGAQNGNGNGDDDEG